MAERAGGRGGNSGSGGAPRGFSTRHAIPRGLLPGTALAAAAFGLSLLVARLGLGRDYYLGALLPAWAMLFLLLAWLLHLREDGLVRKAGSAEGAEGLAREGSRGRTEGTEAASPAGAPDEDPGRAALSALFVPPDADILPRTPAPQKGRRGEGAEGEFSRKARSAFLWAAVELFLAATLLYSAAGVGARYFNR